MSFPTRPNIKVVHPENRAATIKEALVWLPAESKESVFDYGKALRQIDGDEELLHKLIEMYLDDVPKVVAQIGAALGSADYETVARRSHTLRGSLALFCAQRAYNAAFALEQRAAVGTSPQCELQFAALKEEVDQLQLVLAAITESRMEKAAQSGSIPSNSSSSS